MTDDEHIITTQWGSKATTFAALSDEVRRAQMQNCADAMADIKTATGIDIYLAYGCLLGAVRNGRMISHDFDIDLGFHVEVDNKEEIVAQCKKLLEYLCSNYHYVEVETNGQFKAGKLFPDKSYLSLEFFVSWNIGNDYYLYFGVPGRPIAKDILPLGMVEIEGVKLVAPSRPEALLEAIYGPDWQIPNPGFRYENIDWAPFQGFSVRADVEVWNALHALPDGAPDDSAAPSDFADYCARQMKSPVRLLDFGCGVGSDSAYFAAQGHYVVACDYSPTALRRTARTAEKAHLHVETMLLNANDVASMAMAAKKHAGLFDAIYGRQVIDHLSEDGWKRLLRTAKRLLSDEGRFFIEFSSTATEEARKSVPLASSFDDITEFRAYAKELGFVCTVPQGSHSEFHPVEARRLVLGC